MTKFRSDFLQTVVERGFLHQCTDEEGLDALAARQQIVAYIGFDATADSLHVGSLVSIMLLRWLQKMGHRPIVLMGGGTTKVGDPSGKDESRRLLSGEDIDTNIGSIRNIFDSFLEFGDASTDAVMLNNAEWLDDLNYIPFLRDVGRHFSVNRMLGFESVKLRLEREQSLTFLELNYMVLQAYDFLVLNERHGCILQMGGSDQWGNIVSGIDLTRRIAEVQLYGLTSPLIATASGAKMGKTAEGAIWLNQDRLSAYDYWQFWRNTEDADVGRFLRLFTELPIAEIVRLERLKGAEINDAKKILANEATRLCHGEEASKATEATARETFEGGGIDAGLPTIDIASSDLEVGIAAFNLFMRAGLSTTNGAARRLIRGGGGRLNDITLKDENRQVTLRDIGSEGVIKLSAGKKRHALVRPI